MSALDGQSSDSRPAIDVEHLRVMTGGDAELAAEIIDLFQDQVRLWKRLLTATEEPKTWADAAHSLKGSALGLGASRLAKACGIAEAAGRETPPPSRAKAAALLDDVHEAMIEAVEASARLAQDFAMRGAAVFSAPSRAS